MDNSLVSDEEELYRSVRNKVDEEFYYNEDKQLIITRDAFKDRAKQPSVDRAKLKDFAPSNSKLSISDGIITLITKEVRSIGDVFTKEENTDNIQHSVDVIYSPNDNIAHSHVTVQPSYYGNDKKQKRAFKLLRISLARLATQKGWTLEPQD